MFRGHASGLSEPVSVPLNPVPDGQVLALGDPAGGRAELLAAPLEFLQVFGGLAFVSELHQPDAALLKDE
jgi:hypothetical protein